MTCCTPRLCGCPIKINDTSIKDPIVVEPPDPPDPPSEEMCVTHVFNLNTGLMEEVVIPCNELPPVGMCITYVFDPATELTVKVVVPCDELP